MEVPLEILSSGMWNYFQIPLEILSGWKSHWELWLGLWRLAGPFFWTGALINPPGLKIPPSPLYIMHNGLPPHGISLTGVGGVDEGHSFQRARALCHAVSMVDMTTHDDAWL